MVRHGRCAVTLAVATAIVLTAAPAANAHDGVVPTLHHDGLGSVWATAVWRDGHPVTDSMLAIMWGYSAEGEVISPAALQPLPHQRGTVIRPGTLPAGDWTLTLDVTAPGIGYCVARIKVGPQEKPGTQSCPQPEPAAADPLPGKGNAALGWWLAAAGVAAALLIGYGRQHRARRTRRPRRR